jgi:hypothetical protein
VGVESRMVRSRRQLLGFLALGEPVALDARSPQSLLKGVRRGFGVADGCDGRLDAAREGVDQLGELSDCFERPGLAPTGDIWDCLAGGVQSDGAEHDQGRGVKITSAGARPYSAYPTPSP